MTHVPSGHDDQPAVRARIPASVASGQISTGVIIVTGPMEFLLDFVRSLPRPNAIVSRVVLPHGVMPQFVQALEKNLDLYRQRFGPIPGEDQPSAGLVSRELNMGKPTMEPVLPHVDATLPQPIQSKAANEPIAGQSAVGHAQGPASANHPSPGATPDFGKPIDVHPGSPLPPQHDDHLHNHDLRPTKIPNPQDIYDELKLRDELLSGTYANAVMIGHGQFEFSFDFITNFYPQSAVSARVFMAAGHVPRLLESLKASWEQLRPRFPGGGGLG